MRPDVQCMIHIEDNLLTWLLQSNYIFSFIEISQMIYTVKHCTSFLFIPSSPFLSYLVLSFSLSLVLFLIPLSTIHSFTTHSPIHPLTHSLSYPLSHIHTFTLWPSLSHSHSPSLSHPLTRSVCVHGHAPPRGVVRCVHTPRPHRGGGGGGVHWTLLVVMCIMSVGGGGDVLYEVRVLVDEVMCTMNEWEC